MLLYAHVVSSGAQALVFGVVYAMDENKTEDADGAAGR